MITFDDVTVWYPGASTPALEHVDLEVQEASFILVTGATGSGKSTLLRSVNGLVPHFTGGRLAGRVLVAGRDTATHRPRDLAGVVGYVLQDPLATFVCDTVEDEIAYGLETLGTPVAAMRRRVEETLDLLDLAPLRDCNLRTLSGGQQQRVAIAAVLAAGPRILVLDEPTSALDPVAAEDVLSTLHRLVHDLGLTVVLAEHRLERVIHLADQVIRVHDRTATLGAVAAQLSGQLLAPPVVRLGDLIGLDPPPLSVRDARRRTASLRRELASRVQTPVAAVAVSKPAASEPVVIIRKLRVCRGGTEVLHGIDLDLAPGTVTALMGRNGSGKSSLLHTMTGLLKRSAGSVHTHGSRVAMVPQDPSLILYQDSVAADAGDQATLDRWRTLLGGDVAEPQRHPRDLSEGQRLALALAIVLAGDPRVVLLDEPTRGLDYAAKQRLTAWVRNLADAGVTVLVATHDVEFVAQAGDRVVLLAEGEVVSDRPVTAAFSDSPAFAPQVLRTMWPLPLLTVDAVAQVM